MHSGSKFYPEILFEFVSPFISVLVIRAGQNKQRQFALVSVCSNIRQFQPYFSHPFSDEGWDLRRHGAPTAPRLHSSPGHSLPPQLHSPVFRSSGKTMFSVTCLSRTFSITNTMNRNCLKCCPPSLKCQGFGSVSHEKHCDIMRDCVYEDHRAELGIGFTLQIPCRQKHY